MQAISDPTSPPTPTTVTTRITTTTAAATAVGFFSLQGQAEVCKEGDQRAEQAVGHVGASTGGPTGSGIPQGFG